jgi:hypothetical protein
MVKRADEKLSALNKIAKLFNITSVCNSEEDILEKINIGNTMIENVCINLMLDKYITKKNFIINSYTYNECKKEAEKLFD